MKHLLKMNDLTREELYHILDVAVELKAAQKAGGTPPLLAGKSVALGDQTTTSEDFSAFQKRIPGVFLFLGATPPGQDPTTAPANHSPRFVADERVLPVGVRLLAHLAVDYLAGAKGK